MKKEDLWKIYDSNYAASYDERFLTNSFSKLSLDFELNVLKSEIKPDSTWLDLGCGTGHFLSQFPDTKRAGLDISPDMLKLARKRNPSALYFRQGDFRDKVAEWGNLWSLVSCMWGAYLYVDSMKELDALVANMINWTKEGGSIFLPIIDIEDIRPDHQHPYAEENYVYPGNLLVTSITWSWIEKDSGHVHEHMVAPHIEYFIQLLKPYFEKVEILRYPPYQTGTTSRKAIVAKGKVSPQQKAFEAEVIWHDIPAPLHQVVNHPPEEQAHFSPSAYLSHKQLLAELVSRITTGKLFRALGRKMLS